MKSFTIFFSLFIFLTTLSGQKNISLEDIFEKNTFETKMLSGFRFLNDGIHYTKKEKGVLKKFNILSGNFVEDVFDALIFKNIENFNGTIDDYYFGDNEKKILILSESEAIYRHSKKSKVFVFDILEKKLIPVLKEEKISNPSFSPDENKVAFIYENNLYYKNLLNNKEIKITKDGSENTIINGMCDWVYEEEFSFTKAYEWSENGNYIGFIRFDESEVPEFRMEYYENDLYPTQKTFKYPKVGEKNAIVSVHAFNLKSGKTQKINVGPLNDMYIPGIKWTRSDQEICVLTLNRHQNHLQMMVCNVENGKKRILYEEKNKYYVDIHDHFYFLKDGKNFVTTSEKEGYNQIYLYNMDGSASSKLTTGNYDVSEIYGIDEKNGKIYFKASMNKPIHSAVYSMDMKGNNLKAISPEEGSNSAQFSSTFDIFVLNQSTINSPPIYTVYNRDLSPIRVIEDNNKLKEKQKEFALSKVEFFDFVTSEGVRLNGWICKPEDFNPNRKYPVFMTQYSGPGSQSVVDRWHGSNYWWHQMLAQNGYIIVCVDGRGTGNRGEEFKKMTYLKLGHYETIDQIETAKYLASQPYVDKARIGIYGWSYGGFMSTLCILKGNDVFKSAIAVAPVTSWKWYDSIYTERFMRTVDENPEGYAQNSPVYFADQLKGNYLLIHGMADDNVHFQNAVEMANALIKSKKQFQTYFYPNRNHGIYGENARIHLFTKMTNFIYENI